jgi:hypothetical protein
MGLKNFHIFFVTASSLLSFVFGGWCWRYAQADQAGGYRMLGAASFGVGVALIAYGFWFWNKINAAQSGPRAGKGGAIALVLLVWLLGQQGTDACSVCYGQAEGPMIDAARSGVWLLFGLVGGMQISFVAFFVYLWRRGRRFNAVAQSEELIES